MSKVVGVGELGEAVAQLLDEYGDRAMQAILQAAPRAAREARKSLKASSPRGSHSRHYAEGWAVQTQSGRLGIRVVVHNKQKPGLTHLLEHGHANRGGGRTSARPHIAAVNQAAQEQFVREVEARLKG